MCNLCMFEATSLGDVVETAIQMNESLNMTPLPDLYSWVQKERALVLSRDSTISKKQLKRRLLEKYNSKSEHKAITLGQINQQLKR